MEGNGVRVGDSTLGIRGTGAGAVTVGLRPEHLRFGETGLAGQIVQIEPMGREILFVVDSCLGIVRVLEAGSVAAHRVGDQVNLTFSERNTLVFERESGIRVVDARFQI